MFFLGARPQFKASSIGLEKPGIEPETHFTRQFYNINGLTTMPSHTYLTTDYGFSFHVFKHFHMPE